MSRSRQKLAAKHLDTLFIKAEVSNVPFLVTKMEVQVLPCVVGFVAGVSKMKYALILYYDYCDINTRCSCLRIVGFEELEGGDDFSTASLELTMIQCGAGFFSHVY